MVSFAVVNLPELRITLFLCCRKYLLRTLYHDLLNTTKNDASGFADGGEQLIELPQPTTANAKPTHELRGQLHSTLARAIFSICFGESVVLFILLMFQGLDILDVGYEFFIRYPSPAKILFTSPGREWRTGNSPSPLYC